MTSHKSLKDCVNIWLVDFISSVKGKCAIDLKKNKKNKTFDFERDISLNICKLLPHIIVIWIAWIFGLFNI